MTRAIQELEPGGVRQAPRDRPWLDGRRPGVGDDTDNEFLGGGEEDGAPVFWLRKSGEVS